MVGFEEALLKLHGGQAWGRVLDAGTGPSSIALLSRLDTEQWTAVTARDGWAEVLGRQQQRLVRPQDQILYGNWEDRSFLEGSKYDVVLADFLLGSVEMHSPYFSDSLFGRLRPHTNNLLYVHGQEPEDLLPEGVASEIYSLVNRLRDASYLLAGGRRYREFPRTWVEQNLFRSGFEVMAVETFQRELGWDWANLQLQAARQQLASCTNRELAYHFEDALDELVDQREDFPKNFISSHYLIAARVTGD